MSDMAARPSTRIDPEIAWTVVTDSPLKGLVLRARGRYDPRLGRGEPALSLQHPGGIALFLARAEQDPGGCHQRRGEPDRAARRGGRCRTAVAQRRFRHRAATPCALRGDVCVDRPAWAIRGDRDPARDLAPGQSVWPACRPAGDPGVDGALLLRGRSADGGGGRGVRDAGGRRPGVRAVAEIGSRPRSSGTIA